MTDLATITELRYHPGFRNHVSSEALPGALPEHQNSPQRCPYGLYAEQLSGSAFTAPRDANLRTWTYRIRPSAAQQPEYRELASENIRSAPLTGSFSPEPMRWNPPPPPSQEQPVDFIDGLFTMAVNGDVGMQHGVAVHLYVCNRDMNERFFYNADGELLLVPQRGALWLRTELGTLSVVPGEIAVIPRGVKFQVRLPDGDASGYICENYARPFELPELGPIGANGLANPRDFLSPNAAYETLSGRFEQVVKYQGSLWAASIDHSPLDIVAWHGNYAPYKYDLANFNTINTVSFDHHDPSIFTVLTSPSEQAGTANCDFVIFPPRWMVAENTFRPPWFHRNFMSEYMGLIRGVYDAKAEGFTPGGSSLHNCMTPHGPDAATFAKASTADLQPVRLSDTLAFMFESRYAFRPTPAAMRAEFRQHDYGTVWHGLDSHFDPTSR